MENKITKFDDYEYKNPFIKAIEDDNKDFFRFKEEIIKLCEKYEDKLEIDDICFILQNISDNSPNNWNNNK